MRKALFASIVLSLTLSSFAQIVISSADMPLVGDTIQTATDTLTPGFTIGSAGVNQTWDFSAATPDRINTTYVQSPASTPYAANFPTSNRALTQNFSEYVMGRVTAQKYENQGLTGDFLNTGVPLVVQLSPVNDVYRFPTQYGGNYSGTYGFNQTTPYADLPPAIQQQIQSQLPTGVTLVSVITNYTVNYTDQIDGWGKTITPICTYNSLRQRRVENVHLDVDARVTFFGIPSTVGFIDTLFTTTTYNWLAKETKLPVVTTTLSNGAVNSITYSLIPPTLDADFTASSASVCAGKTLNFTDASAGCPDSWSWSFPGGTPSSSTDKNPTGITYSTPGTYAVTLTATRGSQNNVETKTGYITVRALPVAQATSDTICLGKTASLTASGGASYLWSTGASGATLNTSPTVDSTYSVTVTDAFSCSASASASVKVLPLPPADAGANDTICPGEVGSLTATGGVSYQWNTGTTSATLNISSAVTTNYTVTVTGTNGCSASDQATVVVKPAPAADAGPNDTICRNDIATLTASGGVSYSWNNGEATAQINISPASTTTYSVSVYGANGCASLDIATVVVNQLPTINLNNISICFGSSTILDAGNPNAIYNWSTGQATKTITVDTGGAYSVTVTDVRGCSNSDTSVVTISTSLTINLSDHTFCDGDSVVLDAGNPGTQHSWSTGDTTQTLTILSSGFYEVTVTDDIGCTGQSSSLVVVNALPSVNAGDNDTICFGENATLTGSGSGSILWSTNDTTSSITESPALTSTYYLSVTDTNNCVNTDSAAIIVNQLPAVEAGDNDTVCLGESGTLVATGPGSYLWSTGDTTELITEAPMATETYSVTLTDGNTCSASDDATIIVNPLPVADAGSDVAVCQKETVSLIATGGIFYQWNTGQTSDTLSFVGDSSGNYEVVVYNIYACSDTDDVSVTVYTLPIVAITELDDAYCPNINSVLLEGNPAGGTFSGTGVTGNTFNPQSVPVGIFDIIYDYSDSNSCFSSDTAQVGVFPETLVNISGLSSSYCEDAEADSLTVVPGGGILAGAGITGNVFDPEDAGAGGPYVITYTFTDSFNCQYADTALATVNALPVVGISGLDSLYCSNDAVVTVSGSPAGGTLAGNGITGNTFEPALAGVGTHVITYSYSDNGCSNLEKINVTVEVCSGLDERSFLSDLKIYPNPADWELNIECRNSAKDASITFMSVEGKVLFTAPFDSAIRINTTSLPNGVYFVKVYSGENSAVRKVLIQRN